MRIWLFLAMVIAAFGYESEAKYEVSYGFFTLGEAVAHLEMNATDYTTAVSAKATGMAAVLSKHRAETYSSVGNIVDGRFVPQQMEVRSSWGEQTRYMGVFFDHENMQATQIKERCNEGKCSHESELLKDEKYADQDILTLYHNVTRTFLASGEKSLEISAIGSKKPVKIELPEGKRLKTAKSLFKNDGGDYLVVLLNQEIFTSKVGELYVNLDSDQIVTNAALKDTLLFGDVIGKLKEKKITP